jgi:hypothetical protein
MKIFGVSLGRNGTQSLSKFLRQQGFSVTHFYNYKLIPLGQFEESLDGILKHFDSIPDTDAYIDIPTCLVYDVMHDRFPDAKFINIVRPIDDWIASMEKMNGLHGHDGDPYAFEEVYCNFYEKTEKKKIQDLTKDELRFIGMYHLTKARDFFKDKDNYLEISLHDPEIASKIRDFVGGTVNCEFPWTDIAGGRPE